MEKSELYDLIESYLDNTLPENESKAVEDRIANDEDFRREVQLHVDLQKNFSDSARWRLRDTMKEVMKEPVLTGEPTLQIKSRTAQPVLKWIILLASILFIVGLWYWLKPSSDEIQKPDAIEAVPPSAPSTPATGADRDSMTLEPAEKENTPSKKQPEKPLQLAMADPADFEPNPSMESLVNSTSRSQDEISLVLSSPVNNATFTPDAKSETLVRIAGKLEGVSNDTPVDLVLNIFNNRDIARSLFSTKLKVIKKSLGATFDSVQPLKLPQGLYYFTIEHKEEILYAGKFTIGQLN